jgi:hypothetical protein
MDILLVLLRLLHIIAAFAWIGLGGTLALFIAPATAMAGDNGFRFLKTLLTKTAISRLIPMAAGITMLAGILLYLVGNSASHFTSTGNAVLGIGALFGIVAGIHGGAVTGRATTALVKALEDTVSDKNEPIPADRMSEINGLMTKLLSDSRISFVMMAIALLGMGSARYL